MQTTVIPIFRYVPREPNPRDGPSAFTGGNSGLLLRRAWAPATRPVHAPTGFVVGLLLFAVKNKMLLQELLEPRTELLNPAKREQGLASSSVLVVTRSPTRPIRVRERVDLFCPVTFLLRRLMRCFLACRWARTASRASSHCATRSCNSMAGSLAMHPFSWHPQANRTASTGAHSPPMGEEDP